jgi:hypothetical protein
MPAINTMSPQFQDELDKPVNIAEEWEIRSNIGMESGG